MGSLLRLPSLHDICDHCEECCTVQERSCERQERKQTLDMLCQFSALSVVLPFAGSCIMPSQMLLHQGLYASLEAAATM